MLKKYMTKPKQHVFAYPEIKVLTIGFSVGEQPFSDLNIPLVSKDFYNEKLFPSTLRLKAAINSSLFKGCDLAIYLQYSQELKEFTIAGFPLIKKEGISFRLFNRIKAYPESWCSLLDRINKQTITRI